MKRKVIQLAGKTMVVSLPIKWVKRYNVRKGDEIEVEEKGREILLKTQAEPEIKRVEIDTRGQNERVIGWIMSAMYKLGYDEIEFIYDNQRIMEQIQEAVKDFFVGFILVNQTKSRCVIKSISRDSEEEFDAALKRAFMVTTTLGENISEALRNGERDSLKSIVGMERTNNQLTGFCERLLNKRGHGEVGKTCFWHNIAWNLEKICDDYKYICELLLEKGSKKKRVSGELIQLLDEANSYLKDYYDLLYKYEVGKLAPFSARGNSLVKKAESLFKSNKDEEEVVIASIVVSFARKVMDFATSTIPLNA